MDREQVLTKLLFWLNREWTDFSRGSWIPYSQSTFRRISRGFSQMISPNPQSTCRLNQVLCVKYEADALLKIQHHTVPFYIRGLTIRQVLLSSTGTLWVSLSRVDLPRVYQNRIPQRLVNFPVVLVHTLVP